MIKGIHTERMSLTLLICCCTILSNVSEDTRFRRKLFFNFSKNKNKENIHSLMLEVRCSICGKGEEREDQR